MPTTHRQNTPLHALRNTFDARAAARPGTTVEHEGFAKLTGHVVMLGGYRGSVLRDTKTGKRIWAPMRTALGLRTADLSLGLTDADELRSEETVKADKMLTTVAGIVEMGRSLKVKLNALEKAGQITWTNFGCAASSLAVF